MLTIIAGITLCSCDKILLEEQVPDNPVSNFDYLWYDFNQMYGLFDVKKINWDSLYTVYRPMVNIHSSDQELYNAITGLMGHLNDGHVALWPTNLNLDKYNSDSLSKLGSRKDFKYSVVKEHYLIEEKSFSDIIKYGKLPNNIGYIYISDMSSSQKHYKKAMNEILKYLRNTKAIVIDVRKNGGGWDLTTRTIGGRFFTQKMLYLIAKRRNGPEHDDFTEPINYFIEPYGDFQYTNPMVVLTHRETGSAAETFLLGMKRRNDLIQIGDTTSGRFSDAIKRELPNGWLYSVSIGDYRDYNNVSWEGIGVPPDIVVQNDSTDVNNGIDKTMEAAIDYLNKVK